MTLCCCTQGPPSEKVVDAVDPTQLALWWILRKRWWGRLDDEWCDDWLEIWGVIGRRATKVLWKKEEHFQAQEVQEVRRRKC